MSLIAALKTKPGNGTSVDEAADVREALAALEAATATLNAARAHVAALNRTITEANADTDRVEYLRATRERPMAEDALLDAELALDAARTRHEAARDRAVQARAPMYVERQRELNKQFNESLEIPRAITDELTENLAAAEADLGPAARTVLSDDPRWHEFFRETPTAASRLDDWRRRMKAQGWL